MEGYSVVTTDEKRVGHVVGTVGDCYVVEGGAVLRKGRYPLPKRYATADPVRGCLVIHMSKDVLYGGPKVGPDGAFDEAALAEYYGD